MSDFPWYNNYPKGVPREINPDQYKNLPALFEEVFQKYGSNEAYENMGKVLTYSEVDELSNNFAAYLQNEAGLKKGDRMAIQMPNCLQYPIAMIGALKAGVIVVGTNPLYTAREMAHQFKDSGAKAIVIVANFASNLEKILEETEIKTVVVTQLGDMLGGLKGGIVNFVVKNIKKMVPSFNLPTAVKFKDALKKGKSTSFKKPEIDPSDLAFLQYTGGTTGVSKGAQLSHRNLVAHTMQTKEWFKPLFADGVQEQMITALPLYHIFALAVNGILMFSIGAKSILITNPRDMPAFIKELKKHPFTLMTGVNTLFNGLLNQPNIKEVDFSHLKGSIGGGMAVQRAVAEKWKELTGGPLVEGYGLSETSPVLSVNPLDGTERIGTIGMPTPSTDMKILDEEGKEVNLGEPGEICGKGPQVMSGYWNKPELNEETFFNKEWFRTGDIGVQDEDGFFKIVDRKKDMINVSGFNVYPNEIEDVIAGMDKVLEVAVIGIPDEKSTEVVKAFVVKKDESLTEQEILDYCKENLTKYKCPKAVSFEKELPKSNVGKIIRRHLRER
ncbi:long-chain acyl-CoA synthetase [Marivirga sericea]|uniref:Long-chain-fatty-acid--CoA ligase n=1 Tax=Marivirga sericea TaxID=1028 RepID=A0A1X7IRY6_9BACT|nr:AMP-binding protein [Marivirga sericea]SMG17654.1 long-chain acyl-CoA synthetase [Marivirga sericea]